MPYTIATPAQMSANKTGWSLKKFIASCSHKVGTNWLVASEARRTSSRIGRLTEREAAGRQSPGSGLDSGALERRRADVPGLGPDLRDRREEQLPQLLVVAVEDLDHLVVGHRRRPLDADVVVRDHRDVRVAELELARQVALRI